MAPSRDAQVAEELQAVVAEVKQFLWNLEHKPHRARRHDAAAQETREAS